MSADEPRLATGYYLANVRFVLSWVAERYDDLLSPAERRFIDDFDQLSEAGQRLYVRLSGRVGPLIRRDAIRYPEIPDLDGALAELAEQGWVGDGASASQEQRLATLKKDELLALLAVLDPDRKARRRADAFTAVLELLDPDDERPTIAATRPLRLDELDGLKLLFFGNSRQGLHDFVLRDLGLVSYEAYPLSRERRLFRCREEVEDARRLAALRARGEAALALGELEAARELATTAAAEDPPHPLASRHRARLLLAVAGALERAGRAEDARALYARCARPPARERRARLLEKAGSLREAFAIARGMSDGPRDETEVDAAAVLLPRLLRKLGRPARRRPASEPASLTLNVARDPDSSAEALALAGLEARGRVGVHAENRLWLGLFGLACWSIIFADVPGAFHHPFQRGPADLRRGFREAREALIAARVAELKGRERCPELLALFDEKRGLANPFVSWDEGTRSDLAQALEEVPGAAIAAVCDRLSRDLRRYGRGFPDLLMLDGPAGYELLEVKAPGDRLRPEQRAWLKYFAERGIPARVLKLRWLEE